MCVMLILFFKQKTAYEMRIRDWSSDVCSSDLPVDLRRAGPPLRGVGEAEVLVASRFGKIGGRTAMSAPFSMWVPRPVWRSLWDCRHPRSEEHTSELQSLMRISYAVFCLKKQNNINNNRQNSDNIYRNA